MSIVSYLKWLMYKHTHIYAHFVCFLAPRIWIFAKVSMYWHFAMAGGLANYCVTACWSVNEDEDGGKWKKYTRLSTYTKSKFRWNAPVNSIFE